MDERAGVGLLRLTIDTERPVRARDVAWIIDAVNVAFDFGAKRPSEPFSNEHRELRLVRLHAGSLIADLMGFAGGFVTLADFHQAAVRLIRNLGLALRIMAGKSKSDLTRRDKEALHALCTPVAYDKARQVTLQIVGDNANVLIIDAAAARQITDFVDRTNRQAIRDGGARLALGRGRWPTVEDSLRRTLKRFNQRARKGERGSTEKTKRGWVVHWQIDPDNSWPMRLVLPDSVAIADGTEYVFIGRAVDDPEFGLTFFVQSAEHWQTIPIL